MRHFRNKDSYPQKRNNQNIFCYSLQKLQTNRISHFILISHRTPRSSQILSVLSVIPVWDGTPWVHPRHRRIFPCCPWFLCEMQHPRVHPCHRGHLSVRGSKVSPNIFVSNIDTCCNTGYRLHVVILLKVRNFVPKSYFFVTRRRVWPDEWDVWRAETKTNRWLDT